MLLEPDVQKAFRPLLILILGLENLRLLPENTPVCPTWFGGDGLPRWNCRGKIRLMGLNDRRNQELKADKERWGSGQRDIHRLLQVG